TKALVGGRRIRRVVKTHSRELLDRSIGAELTTPTTEAAMAIHSIQGRCTGQAAMQHVSRFAGARAVASSPWHRTMAHLQVGLGACLATTVAPSKISRCRIADLDDEIRSHGDCFDHARWSSASRRAGVAQGWRALLLRRDVSKEVARDSKGSD